MGTSQPSLEATLLLKPDLIVGVDWFKPIYPLLAKIAPTVLDKIDYPDWEAHFSFVAELLGKQDDQKALWQRYYQRIEQLKLALGNAIKAKKYHLFMYGIVRYQLMLKIHLQLLFWLMHFYSVQTHKLSMHLMPHFLFP
ncbi:MAG TPA: ABC transporter substrate-binding protein [Trichormus sp. M33_DOE_039]|nr:ABC transporter substrate-binding protein [Trichormus sp. M33_DOE_039]